MATILRHKSQIYGLNAELAALTQSVADEAARATGVENALRTDLTAETQARIDADNAIAAAALKKAANLADVADVAAARTNLSVDSSAQVDAKILSAQLALGTNYNADDIAARDLLEGLTVGDVVFVADDGDGGWAQYKVSAVDVDGKGTAWTKVMDEDTFLNANSADAIKAAYESNPNTNAFTDEEKAKLGDVDPTDIVKKSELIKNLFGAELIIDRAPSAMAVAHYVSQQVASGGASFRTEAVVVSGDTVVLSFAPKDGVIFNFATVRHVDVNGVAWDIPVVKDPADVSGKTYTLVADSAGQFATKTVSVQYAYTA